MNRREIFKGMFAAMAGIMLAPLMRFKRSENRSGITSPGLIDKKLIKHWGEWEIASNGSMSLWGQSIFPVFAPSGGIALNVIAYWYHGNDLVECREYKTAAEAMEDISHV